jgi:hypothetical protein
MAMPTTKISVRVLVVAWLLVATTMAAIDAWAIRSDLAVIKSRTERMEELGDLVDELNMRLSQE